MAKAKPRFNPNEAAARMFISTQAEQDTHDTQDEQPVQITHDAQPTHNTQGVHDALSTHNTQDTPKTQRAQKHPRINMAFYGDNLEFVREEAWRNKQSITEYVNGLIEQARDRKN